MPLETKGGSGHPSPRQALADIKSRYSVYCIALLVFAASTILYCAVVLRDIEGRLDSLLTTSHRDVSAAGSAAGESEANPLVGDSVARARAIESVLWQATVEYYSVFSSAPTNSWNLLNQSRIIKLPARLDMFIDDRDSDVDLMIESMLPHLIGIPPRNDGTVQQFKSIADATVTAHRMTSHGRWAKDGTATIDGIEFSLYRTDRRRD